MYGVLRYKREGVSAAGSLFPAPFLRLLPSYCGSHWFWIQYWSCWGCEKLLALAVPVTFDNCILVLVTLLVGAGDSRDWFLLIGLITDITHLSLFAPRARSHPFLYRAGYQLLHSLRRCVCRNWRKHKKIIKRRDNKKKDVSSRSELCHVQNER